MMKRFSLLLSVAILIASPFFGQIALNLQDILHPDSSSHMLFWELRIPRVLIAFFSGAILSLAGLVFQSLFRNPLTTPFTLGVASGATLGTAIAIVFLSEMVFWQYALSFAGALLTVLILFLISRSLKSTQTHSLLLVGIALSFFYSAALMVLFFLSDFQQSYSIVRFTMGSLSIIGFDPLYPVSAASILLLGSIRYYRAELKILLASLDFAFLKGIDVNRVTMMLLLITSLAVAVCVSVVGPIGFVGLIVPHIIKTIYRQSSDKLILPTFFYGGVFLVLCDLISRNIGASSDIPIGVITSFLGGPFFIYLIIRRNRGN
ncbi:FecCD family ABC transporter permease [Sulfuricurvum sp.]|uniref:FecCD family ABC transporter permease n=1 Tax=Sulfuricurvum sp. TaxID=2025608 RepID=UPI003569DD8B